MAHTKSYHKNALFKIVKEKRMILQVDAASIMNRKNIQYGAVQLEEEGKIKRQKIKARYKNGNLNDVWLLSLPEVKYDEILNYEMKLVNRPYESPLKIHHCYKSKEDDIKSDITDDEVCLPDNVVNMNDYVKINNHDLGIKEYMGNRVVTFEDIDLVHQRPNGTARRNFSTNSKHFIEGEDYYVFKGDEGRKALESLNYTKLVKLPTSKNFKYYLITETGYLLLVKSLTDDLAWKVQKQLVSGYFKLKEISNTPMIQEALPQVKFDNLDMFELLIKEMKNQRNIIVAQDSKIIELESKFEALKDALG